MDITALAASPVSESRPAGADAKYEPEYEALTAEIAKLSSVSQSAPISWQDVADNGAAILAQKSKDISVAAYTAVALAHIDGARGFLDGVNLLRGICENFWEDAFPPKAKMRRRLNAYEWWHERALEQLRKENQQPIPAELVPEGLAIAAPFDAEAPVASCRNADRPYGPDSFLLTADGFIVSANVTVVDAQVMDTGFRWSDHNPVYLDFVLN